MGSHSGGVLCRQGVGGTVPARMLRGASVDGAAGRALGLEIGWKLWFKSLGKKWLQQALLFHTNTGVDIIYLHFNVYC